jgi:hypothetical protein
MGAANRGVERVPGVSAARQHTTVRAKRHPLATPAATFACRRLPPAAGASVAAEAALIIARRYDAPPARLWAAGSSWRIDGAGHNEHFPKRELSLVASSDERKLTIDVI